MPEVFGLPFDAPSPVIDRSAAVQRREDAIERVEAHAAPTFAELALAAIKRVAEARDRFIVDTVWVELDGAAGTHDNRAMGPIMLKARKNGWIAPTNEYMPSAQTRCHGNPRRIWLSKLKGNG